LLRRTVISLALAMLILCTGVAGNAAAALYWGVFDGKINAPVATVGAANLDGSGATSNYLADLPTPGSTGTTCGVAVNDAYLVWAGERGIGRVNLDGPAAPTTIVPNLLRPCGLTVDQTHVYWGNYYNGTIGRARLDGSEVNPAFVSGVSRPCDVAVAGGYLYWAEPGRIGRVRLDGSELDQSLFPGYGPFGGCGLAVRGQYVYWGAHGSIARASLDGSELDQSFIPTVGDVEGISTDSAHLYWIDHPSRALASVGRAALDGSEPNRTWIPSDPAGFLRSDQSNLLGIAVDARPSPPPLLLPERPLRFGKAKHDVKAGTVRLDVWVPDWGKLAVSAPGLRCKVIADSVPHPKRGGALRWRVYLKPLEGLPGRRVRAQLKNKGIAEVRVSATFTVARTNPVSAVRKLKIRKQIRR